MYTTRRKFLSQLTSIGVTAVLPNIAVTQTNTALEKNISTLLSSYHYNGRLSRDESSAWVITDLVTRKKLISINENISMQCASMVKPFVIQAYLYCHFLKNKQLYPLNEKIMEEMRGMIVNSNNEFTNYIIKRLGGPQGVQWMLRKQASNVFRDISIVEYIPKGGKTYLNRASAGDYTRFLQALWYNRLPGAEILKGLMKIKNHDRIRVNTQYIPESVNVYDKTGSTARLCGDFGIIELMTPKGSYPYTFTGIIEKQHPEKNYTTWITERSNVMRDISDVVYLYFAHKLKLS